MLQFGNKEFRNLQEQVFKNQKDIEQLKLAKVVLDEFGFRLIGHVDTEENLPTVAEYKEANPDWQYGDAVGIGEVTPYDYRILSGGIDGVDDWWFDIGLFPMPGPQGPQGVQGHQGPQGQTGNAGIDGAAAGFGNVTANVSTLDPGEDATVSVTTSGTNAALDINFEFGLPYLEYTYNHYVSISGNKVNGASGSLSQANYNKLNDNEDSCILYTEGQGAWIDDSRKVVLKKWFKQLGNEHGDKNRIFFVGLVDTFDYDINNTAAVYVGYVTSTRQYVIHRKEIRVEGTNILSTNASANQVLTADGNNASSWTSLSDVAYSGDYNDLLNTPSIPAAQVQADYAQNNSSAVDFIKNKPDLSVYALSASLANVATSGNYSDLLGTPNLSVYAQKSELANVATTGNFSDLTLPVGGIPDADIANASTWNAKQNALTAGSNINISGNIISATDTTYNVSTETWTFTLSNNSSVTKTVVVGVTPNA